MERRNTSEGEGAEPSKDPKENKRGMRRGVMRKGSIITEGIRGTDSKRSTGIEGNSERGKGRTREGIKMLGNTQLIIITLNVNGMNSPIKWKQKAEWIRNQNPTICCLQETHMRQVDAHQVKIKD